MIFSTLFKQVSSCETQKYKLLFYITNNLAKKIFSIDHKKQYKIFVSQSTKRFDTFIFYWYKIGLISEFLFFYITSESSMRFKKIIILNALTIEKTVRFKKNEPPIDFKIMFRKNLSVLFFQHVFVFLSLCLRDRIPHCVQWTKRETGN